MDLKTKIQTIFERLDKKIPNAEIELDYDESPYMLLVAVILSARSTDKQVNKATSVLFQIARTPEQILALGYEKLCSFVNTIGLYKNKAKNILSMTQMLINKFDGQIPQTREELMLLPGVGRKSADVILNVVYQQGTVAVDTHVFRVATRLQIAGAKTPEKMSDELEKFSQYLDEKMMRKVHHLMVLHGRYVCKSVKPKCVECVLSDLCPSRRIFVKE